MLCLNVPKKVTSLISVWGSMLLILIAVFLCFQPMFTLSVDTKILDSIDDMLYEVSDGEVSGEDIFGDLTVAEDVEVSVVDLASGVSLLAKMVTALTTEDAALDAEFEAMMESEEGQKTLKIITAVAVTLINAIDPEKINESIDKIENIENNAQDRIEGAIEDATSEENVNGALDNPEDAYGKVEEEVGSIVDDSKEEIADVATEAADNVVMFLLNGIMILIALLIVLVMTIIIPIRICISALIALITALVNVKKPDVASPKVVKRLPGMLAMPLTLMLFSCLVPSLGIGSGAMGILIVCFVSVLLAVVLSRLHSYTPAQMKYANVLQGVSLVGLAGYLVFFFNVLNVGVFGSFVNGLLGKQIRAVSVTGIEGAITGEKIETVISAQAATGWIIDVILVLLAVIFVLVSTGYLSSCLRRLSFAISVKKGKSSIKDIILPRALLMLPIYILPAVVMNSTNYFEDVSAEVGTESLLVLSEEQMSSFNGVLAGIVTVIVAEIAMIVLKAVLCANVSAKDKGLVMSGAATAEIAAPAAPAEDAPAEEAPAEDVPAMAEAPVEEAPAEEAPAEDVPAEDAPAEVAPVEEAPAEEVTEKATEEATEEK